MSCMPISIQTLPIRAIDNMGITLNASKDFDARVVVRRQLASLTPREFEICVLHFVEGHSQLLIADWLNIQGRTVRLYVKSAVQKVPQLKRLRIKSKPKPKGERPKIFHLSQLRPTERGAFNADEV